MDEDTALELFIMAARQRQRRAVDDADNMLSTIEETRRVIAKSRMLDRLAATTGATQPWRTGAIYRV
ncbi:hypothetical protein [Mesorhizobium sp. dw_380]|uniref:hypothetical protein n=1 Tax=Mesorhizobium sp. dw_380 TaxID=2812001 RepID=UPI001BDE79E2|nr:hypothetical protein [Mesorhizobium sp. dw_380]